MKNQNQFKNQRNSEVKSDFGDIDFNLGGSGKVTTLESFLEEDTPPIDNEETPLEIKKVIEKKEEIPEDKLPKVEEKKVEKKVEKKDDKDIPLDIIDDVKEGLSYKEIISKFIEDKVWDGIDSFETEDGEEISYEDMEIDEETFFEIYKQKQTELQEKLLENKVSTTKISNFTQKLIEIEKNGGDVQQALDSYQQYKNPLEGLDLEKESDQQAVIYLKLQAKGIDEKDIVDIIKTYQTNGSLEEKSKQAKVDIESAFEQQMDSINDQAKAQKEANKDALKKYRVDLKEELKQFQLTDTYTKKLIDVAAKEKEGGSFELDKIYSEMRQDPKQVAELVLFLTDKEEYLKQITESVVRDKDLNTMKRFKLVKKGKSSVTIDKKKDDSSKNFIDLGEV